MDATLVLPLRISAAAVPVLPTVAAAGGTNRATRKVVMQNPKSKPFWVGNPNYGEFPHGTSVDTADARVNRAGPSRLSATAAGRGRGVMTATEQIAADLTVVITHVSRDADRR